MNWRSEVVEVAVPRSARRFVVPAMRIRACDRTIVGNFQTITMSLSKKLNRPLRAAEEDSDDDEYADLLEGSSPSVLATGDGGEIASSEEEDDGEDSGQDEVRTSPRIQK